MPQNITDANTFTSPIVAPAAGDPRKAASVLVALQGLANRTNFLNLLRGAANGLATLTAGGVVTPAQIPYGAANGVAQLDGTSHVTPAQLPYGLANGIAQCDGSARVPAASVRNGIVGPTGFKVTTGWLATYQATASASLVDVSLSGITFSGTAAGDIVLALATFGGFADAAGTAAYQLAIVDGGSPIACPQTLSKTTATLPVGLSQCLFYPVANGGTVTVKMQFSGDGTHNGYVNGAVQFFALLLKT